MTIDTKDLNKEKNKSSKAEDLIKLMEIYDSLPEGAHKDFVWEECWFILSSLMSSMLKNAPENSKLGHHSSSKIRLAFN